MKRFAFILLLLPISCLAQGFSDASAPFLLSTSSLRKGLVGYWRLEEASGTRYDCSKTGAHFSSANSPTNAAGKVQNCVSLVAASSQYLAVTNSVFNPGSGDFTIAFWVKFLTFQTTYPSIVNKFTASGNQRGWTVYYDKDFVGITLATSYNGTALGALTYTTNALVTNLWYMVTAQRSGTNLTVSLNNASTRNAAITNAIFSCTAPLAVGVESGLTFGYFNGFVDELGIWNRALSTTETAFLYNSGNGTHFPWAHP